MATDEVDSELRQYWGSSSADFQNIYLPFPNQSSPIPSVGQQSPGTDILHNIQPRHNPTDPWNSDYIQLARTDAEIYDRWFGLTSPSPPARSPEPTLRVSSGSSWATGSTIQSSPTIAGTYPSPQLYISLAAVGTHSVETPVLSKEPNSTLNTNKRKAKEIEEVSKIKRPRKETVSDLSDPLKTSKKRKSGDADDALGERANKRVVTSASPQASIQQSGPLEIQLITQDLARQGKYGSSKRKSEKEKEQSALVRRAGGSCFKCRMLNKKCHASNGVCPPCKINPQLCFRLDLNDCVFYRTTTPLHSTPVREQDKTWASNSVLTLNLHCVPLDVAHFCKPLTIQCKQFIPVDGDNLKKSPGGKHPDRYIEVPPYIAHSSKEVYKTLLERMASYRQAFLIELHMKDKQSSAVTVEVLKLADKISRAQKGGLIHAALDIWVCAHLNAVERSLCGDELLGMPPDIIDDNTSFLFNHVPIPPQLDNQLDNLILNGMNNNAKILLRNMWTRFKKKDQKDWLELWLTTYILLNTVEFVIGIQQGYVAYLKDTYHRNRILRHWEKNRELWSWSANHIVDAFVYYHKLAKLPLGTVLNKEMLSSITNSSNILDNEALRQLRITSEKVQAAVREVDVSNEASTSVDGKIVYDAMWTSKILSMK